MAVTDIASRTYNHGWRLDPIVRSLLDTDFYKLLMQQMIREFYPDQQVTFSVINRSKHVRLGEIIDEGELRAQLDHARSLRFAKKELIWLAGNTFYGKTQTLEQAIDTVVGRTLDQLGLTMSDWHVLTSLRWSGEPYRRKAGWLSRRAVLTSGAMTSRLDRLEEAGYVRRLPDPGRWCRTVHEVHIGLIGGFIDASHRIIKEVGLVDDPLRRRNFSAAHDAGSEHRCTLERRPRDLRVYDRAGIDHGGEAAAHRFQRG